MIPRINHSFTARGLATALFLAVFLLLSGAIDACAVMIKVKIISNIEGKEYPITVNGITKLSSQQSAVFDVQQGNVDIEVGRKHINKIILKPSLVQIYYVDKD